MENIVFTFNQDIVDKAIEFEMFRERCKAFLKAHEIDFDKFTIVSHDAFLGYVSEQIIKEYILQLSLEDPIEVKTWDSAHNLDEIKKIITAEMVGIDEIAKVKEYFYDKYDIEIIKNGKSTFFDVKTALTQKEPKPNWNFLYPVIQANNIGKDYMVLIYYITKVDDPKTGPTKMVLIGYIGEDVIKKCHIIRKGEMTRFRTVSQTENYETEIGIHYGDLNELINKL